MNFNIPLLFIFITACGVKGDPRPPQGAYVPSVIENYPDVKLDDSLKDGSKQ